MTFARNRVRTENLIAKLPPRQWSEVELLKAGAGRSLDLASRVVLKTGADNLIQVRFRAEKFRPPAKGSPVPGAPVDSAGKAQLGYYEKVQDGKFEWVDGIKKPRNLVLSGHGKRMLREASAVLTSRFGLNVLFITCTLPGSTWEALDTFAAYSTDILNSYMQDFRDIHRSIEFSSGGDWLACGVWEYQKRGALHLHLVVGCDDPKLKKIIQARAKKWWIKKLQNIGEKTGVDLFAKQKGGSHKGKSLKHCVDVQQVRKDVGRYISKYVSKDAQQFLREGFSPPSSWWFLSKELRSLVMEKRNETARRFISIDEGERLAVLIAEEAQKLGATVFPTHNPFSGNLCGYQLYFDVEGKDEFYKGAAEFLESESESNWNQDSPLPEWMAVRYYGSVSLEDVELMFAGKPPPAVPDCSADLCAPLSSLGEGRGGVV